MRKKRKNKDKLDFTNDRIFKYVLSSDIDLCREFIRRIDPEINTEGIRYIEKGHEAIAGAEQKMVSFDVYVGNKVIIINLEMFNYKPLQFIKTARHNAAMIDSDLKKGLKAADLPDIVVILLCSFDPIGQGRPIYRYSMHLDEDPDFKLDEGRKIVIVTNKGYKNASEELKPIIYLLTRNPEPIDDPFYQKIQKAVKEAKTNPEVRKDIMMQEAREQYFFEKGEKKGVKKGEKKGRMEALEEAIRKTAEILGELKLSANEIQSKLLEKYPDQAGLIKKILASDDFTAA